MVEEEKKEGFPTQILPVFVVLPKTREIKKNTRMMMTYANENVFTVYFNGTSEEISRVESLTTREYVPGSVIIFHLDTLDFKLGKVDRLTEIQRETIEICLSVISSMYNFLCQVAVFEAKNMIMDHICNKALDLAYRYFPKLPDVNYFITAPSKLIEYLETLPLDVAEELIRRWSNELDYSIDGLVIDSLLFQEQQTKNEEK